MLQKWVTCTVLMVSCVVAMVLLQETPTIEGTDEEDGVIMVGVVNIGGCSLLLLYIGCSRVCGCGL